MQPKTLILNLLRAHGDVLEVSQLLRAGEVFELPANTVRVALSRLAAQGLVTQVSRGRWRMARAGAPLAGQVDSWRTIEDQVRPWTGMWVGAAIGGLGGTRAEARARRRALDFMGFRTLRPGFEIRPDNRVGCPRERLAALGVVAPVFAVGDLGPDQDAGMALWESEALTERYAACRVELAEVTERLPDLELAEAARSTWVAGSNAIRTLALDPLLPEEMVDVAERRALGAQMRAFDDFGRVVWRQLLEVSEVTPC